MARRLFVRKYDDIKVIDKAIQGVEEILSTLNHPKLRASVTHCIGGLKAIKQDLNKPENLLKKANEKRLEKNKVSRGKAINVMQRWTIDDDKFVLESSLSDIEIGLKIGRSRDAVHTRRMRLLNGQKVVRI